MAATHPIAGKTVLITGAARGIGAESARALARRGAKLALVGLEPEELARVATELGPDAESWELDVTDREGLERVFGEAAERFGGIDAVVANAGIASGGTVEAMDEAAFERVIEVNLLGAYRTIKTALPHLVKSDGYLLAVASVAAIGQAPLMGAYSASKAGLEAMCNSLRIEVAHRGVDVGVAYFSWLSTELVSGADEHPSFALMRSRLGGPTGKTYPVSKAAAAIANGIERRSHRVYTPGWIRGMQSIRGHLPRFLGRQLRAHAPEIVAVAEAEASERGAAASEPVGAGGQAFVRSRGERSSV